jgi:O-antigen/teichoic acid export membrane protein
MGVISRTTDSLDQLLLWHFAGPVQVAVYSLAFAPMREIRAMAENIFPLLFPKYATKTVPEMKRNAPLRIFQFFIISAGVAALYIIAAPYLFHYVFPKYASSIFTSQLLAVALIFQPKGIVETMLYAQGNAKLRYITVITTQIAKAIFWIILIPLYGANGAVAGIILSDATSALMYWWTYKKMS